jgi:hypothetical protein
MVMGARWGRVLLYRSPYPTSINLHVTLSIPNWDEKLNLILAPNGFRYLCHILVPAENHFFNKKISFFPPSGAICVGIMGFTLARWILRL